MQTAYVVVALLAGLLAAPMSVSAPFGNAGVTRQWDELSPWWWLRGGVTNIDSYHGGGGYNSRDWDIYQRSLIQPVPPGPGEGRQAPELPPHPGPANYAPPGSAVPGAPLRK